MYTEMYLRFPLSFAPITGQLCWSRRCTSLLPLENLHQAEIIVVDNQSTDDTAAAIKGFIGTYGDDMDIRYLLEPVQGLSAARNTGILASKSQLIAFLDDDAIPCRTWITTIVSTFAARPEVMAMGGKIAPIFESKRPDWLIKPFELPYTIVDLGGPDQRVSEAASSLRCQHGDAQAGVRYQPVPAGAGPQGRLAALG
ncbi:glycosyltransferase [Paenibacillus rhizoplanae]